MERAGLEAARPGRRLGSDAVAKGNVYINIIKQKT